MTVMLLTEHHLAFLSLKGGCNGSSESTLVKCHIVENLMPWLILFTSLLLRGCIINVLTTKLLPLC